MKEAIEGHQWKPQTVWSCWEMAPDMMKEAIEGHQWKPQTVWSCWEMAPDMVIIWSSGVIRAPHRTASRAS
jgi:hypothetical protein